jgi:hypothetical protein
MKLRNKLHQTETIVYGISVSMEKINLKGDQVGFYVAEEGLFGLGYEVESDVEIIDRELGMDFKFHKMEQSEGFMLLWNYFTDIAHLSDLIELKSETLSNFEQARRKQKFC